MAKKPTKADLEQRIRELEQENLNVRETARQTQERYRSLFDHSVEMYYVHDFKGRFLDANDKVLERLGYTRDEIPDHNLASIIHPEDLSTAARLFKELMTVGFQKEPSEYRIMKKGGGFIWVEASSSVIYRDGAAYAVQGIARDITSRKQAEEILRLSEEKHRGILENIEEAYYELDLKGNVVFCNSAALSILGYEPHEMIGISYREYTSPETANRMYEVFHALYETGDPQRLVDYEVIRKDGSIRNHELSAGLMRDASGNPSGFHVLVHDITLRKQAQERLKKSEEHYRTIFENTGTASILIAEDTTILLANSNFEKLTGYTKEEMEGRMSWTVFIAPEDLARMKGYHALRREDTTSVPGAYEFRLKNRSGGLRDIFLTVAMIPGTRESVASCMDITERKRAEEDLRRSEERYRGILQTMEEAYYEVDLKGNLTFFNQRAGKALGLSDEMLKGLNFREFMDEDNAQKVIDAYTLVYNTRESITGLDWEIFNKDGQKITVEASVSLITEETGRKVGFRGVVRDITQRKKAEAALKASEEKYRGILESMQESYFEVDLGGNFTSFNQAAIEMSGYSREELQGMNFRRYSPPETQKLMFETFHQVYVTRKPQQLVNYQVIHKNGSLHDNELSVWPMKDASGNVVGFHSLVRDVTSRKRVEQALRENEERYRAIFENTGNASVLIAKDTTILLANSNFAKLTGYTKEEIEGKMSWTAFVDPSDLEMMRQYHDQRRLDSTMAPQSYEFHLKTRSGEVRNIFLTIVMIPGTMESVASCMDITDRKRSEENLRRSEERYRSILENMEEAYLEVDLAGTFRFFNDSFCRILGYSREEIMCMNYKDVSRPGKIAELYRIFNEVYRTGNKITLIDHEIVRKDGSAGIVEMSVSLMVGPTGEPVGFSGVGRDATARIHAENALKESERKYRLLAENLRDVIWVLDTDLKYVYVSPSVFHLRGYTPEEAMEQTMEQVLTAESYQRALEFFTRGKLLETSGQRHGKEWAQNIDLEMICKDGSTVWTEVTINILYDEEGAPTGLLGITHDISERRNAAQALRESEERWLFALEGAGDGVWDYDVVAKSVYRSRRWKEMLGYAEAEITESPDEWARLVHPGDIELSEASLKSHLKGEAPVYVSEYRIRCRDGSYKWVLDRGKVLRFAEDGSPLRIIGTQSDITERKQAEEALVRSEERYRTLFDGMLDGVYRSTHDGRFVEINNAMAEMFGYADKEEMMQVDIQSELYFSAEERESLARKDIQTGKEIHCMRRKDGSAIWVEDHARYVHDDQGNILFHEGTLRDVTERMRAEEALKKSEERYRTIFESTATANIIVAEDTTILVANSNFEKLSGYSRQELEGKMSWTSFIVEDNLDEMERNHRMRRVDPSQAPSYYEFRARTRSGEVRNFFMNVSMIPGTTDSVVSMIDVTERRQAEEAIKKSEEFYRTIFENTGNASMLLDKDTTVLLVNTNFERLSGYTRAEIEGKMSWTVFVSPDDLARMRRYHELRRKEGGVAPDSYEFTFVDRQGRTRDVFLSIALIPGTMISVASLMDITERKKAEKALRESEERFRDLARLLPETVFESDDTGRLTFVNEISLERFGYTQEEVDKGLNILDVIAPEDHERVIANYARVMNGERIGLNEYYATRRDGTVFPALIHTTVVYRDGKPSGLRGFLIDITEKKNLENQLLRAQKMEAVGTLAGGIAHDFNNLLMGILGNVSLMLMHFEESHPFHDRLKSMEEYVQRGSDLTKQLLGFARGGKYEVKPTHLGEFVRKSSEMFGRTKKEIRIHHKIADGLWTVDVDRGQMEQVMLNLYVNAWQAMPGGGDLYISAENSMLDDVEVSPYGIQPGRFVRVTVTDTGVGMDDSVKARIFEPFFTTKERGRGTGLGLASVYGIIKNHGGFIHVESEKDLGTSFVIHLPASDKEVPQEPKKNGELKKGQETVLLIDDEEMILEVGSSMLEGLGYKVITAPGGRQGLKVYEQSQDTIGLVILDMIMPDFGGKETFDTLRRVNPGVKVLLSSGYSLDGQAKEIMKSGCRGFIQKPFSMADLSKKIREILDEE